MKRISIANILFLFALTAGCSTTSKVDSDSEAPFKLSDFRKITESDGSRKSATQILGKPDGKFRLEYYSKTDKEGEIWAYLKRPSFARNRLSLIFEDHSEQMTTMSWDVFDGDPETDLEVAKSRFEGSEFVGTPIEWINPYSMPDEIFYEDKKHGISIVYLRSTKRVRAILWTNPKESVASVTQ